MAEGKVKSEGIDAALLAIALEGQRKANETHDASEELRDTEGERQRKKAEANIRLKAQDIKRVVAGQTETFNRQDPIQARWREIEEGLHGPEAGKAALEWSQNESLQAKLTAAQKRLFQDALLQDTPRAAKAAGALARLAEEANFNSAIVDSGQAGTLQKALLEDPHSERSFSDVIKSRFMRTRGADHETKKTLLSFGLGQARKGNEKGVRVTSDVLGVLAETRTSGRAQKDVMAMMSRDPHNYAGAAEIDTFSQQPAILRLPSFARSKSISLLAKSDAAPEVSEGFVRLASDPTFRKQTPKNKGLFYATIGEAVHGPVRDRLGTEFRALTDKALVALQSQKFPRREGQVKRFLTMMGQTARQSGAAGVKPGALIKSSKGGPLPPVPRLLSTEGRSEDEANRVRRENRAKVFEYFNEVTRSYKAISTRIETARVYEDINLLPNLRSVGDIDVSGLHPEDPLVGILNHKAQKLKERYKELVARQKMRMRELYTTRESPAKRRSREHKRRLLGQQKPYFRPGAIRGGHGIIGPQPGQGGGAFMGAGAAQRSELPATPGLPHDIGKSAVRPGLARTPMRGTRAERFLQGNITESEFLDAEEILEQVPASLGRGERLSRVKKLVSQQFEEVMKAQRSQLEEILENVLERIDSDESGGGHVSEAGAEGGERIAGQQAGVKRKRSLGSAERGEGAKRSKVQGKVDGWGVQRTFVKELGGQGRDVVRAPEAVQEGLEGGGLSREQLEQERFTKRPVVRPSSAVRNAEILFDKKANITWIEMSDPERACLKNLGWSQTVWDAKNNLAARWPIIMRTRYDNLANSSQRQSVRELGFSMNSWDAFVRRLDGGSTAA